MLILSLIQALRHPYMRRGCFMQFQKLWIGIALAHGVSIYGEGLWLLTRGLFAVFAPSSERAPVDLRFWRSGGFGRIRPAGRGCREFSSIPIFARPSGGEARAHSRAKPSAHLDGKRRLQEWGCRRARHFVPPRQQHSRPARGALGFGLQKCRGWFSCWSGKAGKGRALISRPAGWSHRTVFLFPCNPRFSPGCILTVSGKWCLLIYKRLGQCPRSVQDEGENRGISG